jgi:hypothetical protein
MIGDILAFAREFERRWHLFTGIYSANDAVEIAVADRSIGRSAVDLAYQRHRYYVRVKCPNPITCDIVAAVTRCMPSSAIRKIKGALYKLDSTT